MNNAVMQPVDKLPLEALEYIKSQHPDLELPRVGLILGSVSNNIAEEIQHPKIIPYENIPGLRKCGVEGHCGELYFGTLKDVPVVCFSGRNHVYEAHSASVIAAPIRIMKLLGVETVILVSAAGAISSAIEVGSIAIVKDHLNFIFFNPLYGPNDEFWGPRFPDLTHAYDKDLRKVFLKNAKKLRIKLREAVYVGTQGPSFETPAEIKAYRKLGADVVGMSTVPEVITAVHCGIKVVVLCMITNKAAGLGKGSLDHTAGLEIASRGARNLSRLILGYVEMLGA